MNRKMECSLAYTVIKFCSLCSKNPVIRKARLWIGSRTRVCDIRVAESRQNRGNKMSSTRGRINKYFNEFGSNGSFSGAAMKLKELENRTFIIPEHHFFPADITVFAVRSRTPFKNTARSVPPVPLTPSPGPPMISVCFCARLAGPNI
jgi:hypothetical protein